jgi:hypothetical protein
MNIFEVTTASLQNFPLSFLAANTKRENTFGDKGTCEETLLERTLGGTNPSQCIAHLGFFFFFWKISVPYMGSFLWAT